MKKVLVLNAGSSSLKFQVVDMQNETLLAKGLCERIGLDDAILHYQRKAQDGMQAAHAIPDHHAAIRLVLDTLTAPGHGILKDMDEIMAVGHRVPHGGEDFDRSVLIDDAVMALIRANAVLAPLHSPPIIAGIEACKKLMPTTPMVAVFDTAFHQTMPPKAYVYGLPYEAYTAHKIRRYGFHGTSHFYVAHRAAAISGRPVEELKIVTCHLGNGSSLAAVKNGASIDTTMGFTPLAGIPMGTRCGDIDPAIVLLLMEMHGWSIDETNAYLQKQSGVYGVSGISSDFRDLHAAAGAGNERAALALDVFAYAVRRYIGAYAAAMEGLDCIVFTGGIGEHDAFVREQCVTGLEFMGVHFDAHRNRTAPSGAEYCISLPDSKVQVYIIPTNEELVIARDTARIAAAQPA